MVPRADPVVSLWRLPGIRRLLGVTLLGFAGFAATLGSLPWWAVEGGASVSTAGLVTTAMLVTTVATQAVVPAIVRRLGSGRSLAIGLVALGAPCPLYALFTDLGPLLAISAVRGVGFALLTVIGSTLTRMLAPPGRHGEAAGLYGLAIGVTGMAAVPGAVALAQSVGYWPVALLAGLPVLAVPAALRLSDGRDTATASAPSVIGHRRAVQRVLVPSVLLMVVTLSGSGVVTFVPIERPDGLLAAVALLVFGVTGAVGRWRVGVLADRAGARLLLPASLVTTAVGLAGVAGGLAAGSDTLLVGGAAISGLGYGAVQNLTLVVAFRRVDPVDVPTASAVWNISFDTGTAVGAVAVGAVAAWGADAAGQGGVGIAAALGMCAALLALAVPLSARTTA